MSNIVNDPWQKTNFSETEENPCKEFEDNFTELGLSKIEKLPDSEEYLASLESKLAKIKKGKGNKKTEGKELIKSLEESNDSCMYRLIAGNSYSISEQDLLLDAPANFKLSSKWLNPEQALTVGELVELVKADYLEQASSESSTTEDSEKKNSTIQGIPGPKTKDASDSAFLNKENSVEILFA